MIRLRLAALSLLVLPALASAQGKKKMGGEDDTKVPWDQIKKEADAGIRLSVRDVEDLSPVKLLVDKRRDLKLTDDQAAKLKDMDAKLRDKNKPLLKSLDSLKSETKPRAVNTAGGTDDQTRVSLATNDFMAVFASIRLNYEESLKDAMPLLDATTQVPKATELLAKAAKDAEEMLQDKLGARAAAVGGFRAGRIRP